MSDTEKEFKLTRFNRYLNLHSWVEWLDFIDKMREDHYIFFSAQKKNYKYNKLKNALKIKKGWLIADHNHIIYNMLRMDFSMLNDDSNYTLATPFVPDYSESEKTKRYMGVHGAEDYPHINAIPGGWGSTNTDRLSRLMNDACPSGVIFHELCDLYALYNGFVPSSSSAYCSAVGKVYDNHNGVTPTGEYREINNPETNIFGNWQTLTRDSDGTWRAMQTWNLQAKINFKPEFDVPYRLVMAGLTRNSFEFNGLGVAEFADRWNVFFDSGPVQGAYTSPLIGTDQFYTCRDPEAFKNITNQHASAGWQVYSMRLFILPPEGHFSYDYVPEEERDEWASYMVKRLHKKFPKCYPAITQEENQ